MRTRSAKTVPPGPAMGPSMVRAARKMEKVAKVRVSSWARIPLGGQTTPHRLKLKVKMKVTDGPNKVEFEDSGNVQICLYGKTCNREDHQMHLGGQVIPAKFTSDL